MKYITIFTITFVLALCWQGMAQSGQISIARIEQMPALPHPWHIRDWAKVARQYDSLAFNLQAQGEYLPLVFTEPGINYPEHEHVGLPSYVGVKNVSAEAINVLPALIGATLVGIDKSDQNGRNWVLMAEDFFNRRAEENVYLNNFQGSSGNDWWYDTMPNVFFYQLYDLYPQVGHFPQQFITVADRWLQAVKAMGGSATPWTLPDFNHRAWRLSNMTPNDDGVKEPEAAGAIGWLLYMAYVQTGNDDYRIGAEWSLEYLSGLEFNPFYELQLPYGAYVAARMNAELGTDYDIVKILNWCFDPAGNVRGWGATVGNWGGYDCSGLIGEVMGDDYAFAMNTFEMLGALLPLVRYDERFARSLGRWALNAVNAARLFYGNALPAQNQDSENWDWQYDPQGVIAYEALRERAWYSDTTPFATGDALRNGWANTNLALYGASHVGLLGALVDTTDIRGILKLNVRATDFFTRDSLREYLLYNPYDHDTLVTVDVGSNEVRLYDVLRNRFMNDAAQGKTTISVPADQALLLCLVPAGAQIQEQGDRLLADGTVVDFHSGTFSGSHAPRIKALKADNAKPAPGQSVTVYCTAEDRDGDTLSYTWSADAGSIVGQGAVARWTAPQQEGKTGIVCRVSDGNQAVADTLILTVGSNHAPVIESIGAEPEETLPGQVVLLKCCASDADGDSLQYRWFISGADTFAVGPQAEWTAPQERGFYWLHCAVSDGQGGRAEDSVGVANGDLVLWLPLDGNAQDVSPFRNNGQCVGVRSVADFKGTANAAFHFDGQDDYVQIAQHPSLDFQNAITVAFWMQADTFLTREEYPVSHGNWENRWKISLTNGHLRWTIKTEKQIYDLDSQQALSAHRFYFVTCTYDGNEMVVYLNGEKDAKKTASGKLLQTSYDLVLGQALPGNLQYGFQGTLDEFRLYNRAMSAQEVQALYRQVTGIAFKGEAARLPAEVTLLQNFPNPFNPQTHIRYYLPQAGQVRLDVFDVRGRRVKTLVRAEEAKGWHGLLWRVPEKSSGVYFLRLQFAGTVRVVKTLVVK